VVVLVGLVALKNPKPVVFKKLMLPVMGVGVEKVSVTLAMHVVLVLSGTDGGPHERVVDVECWTPTVMLLLLPPWRASPLYVPVILAMPVVDAENVTEQRPPDRVHGLPVKEPVTPD